MKLFQVDQLLCKVHRVNKERGGGEYILYLDVKGTDR